MHGASGKCLRVLCCPVVVQLGPQAPCGKLPGNFQEAAPAAASAARHGLGVGRCASPCPHGPQVVQCPLARPAGSHWCPGWFQVGLVGTKPAPSTGPHWLCLGRVGGGQNAPRGGQGWHTCARAPPGRPWLGHGQQGAKGVAWGGRGGVQSKFSLKSSPLPAVLNARLS